MNLVEALVHLLDFDCRRHEVESEKQWRNKWGMRQKQNHRKTEAALPNAAL
jgi:hypothetical protein